MEESSGYYKCLTQIELDWNIMLYINIKKKLFCQNYFSFFIFFNTFSIFLIISEYPNSLEILRAIS